MRKFLFIVFVSFQMVQAQQVQWASKLIKFSSDLGGKQNGVKRILGRPDAFPQGGSSPNAWCPKDALKGRDYVEVGFEKPQSVKQVAIFENLNAGCVSQIMVDTGSGKYETVWARKRDWKTPTFKATIPADHNYYFKRKRRKIQEAPDVINPGVENAILDNAISNVVAVRVEFNFALLPGQKQVDAIGISDSELPIQAQINTITTYENLGTSTLVSFGAIEVSTPTLSKNGNELCFTDNGQDKEQIYVSTKEANGKWGEPILQTALNENEMYNYIEYFGNDFMLRGGSEYQKGAGETGFAFLDKTNEGYTNPKKIKIAAYNNYDDTADATITADKKVLILGIETDFTQGGADLYFTNAKEDGTYGLLQNMGKNINSAADEITPQLLSDTKTLLFSSNGYSSYGDYDIFVTHRLDDTWKKWSEPVNLVSKINGENFEASPYYDEQNEVLYYTKSIEGRSSLYSIKISKLELMQL